MDDLPARIEHTVLGPTTTPADIRECLGTARDLGMRVCLPPWGLSLATAYDDVPVATVVDFPHGQGATDAVCGAATHAREAGADELDVVCNVGRLRAGDDEAVHEHLVKIVAAVPIPVKVIVEAPLLSDADLHRVGDIAAGAGAAYLKTATGFSEGGATVEDVELLSQYRPVKASGGIGSLERAEAMFEAGAERIGASSGDTIVEQWRDQRDERC